jgi:AraC family transcriptional regulator
MLPHFEVLPPTTLVGHCRCMTLLADSTADLWQDFQRLLRAQGVAPEAARYSVRVYQPGYFEDFNPAVPFEKWASVALGPNESLLPGTEMLVLPGGLYAVFDYRGPAAAGSQVFNYIFGTWLPASGYVLDERPHFEVLGERFHRTAPDSEEEIWVPVRPRL